MNTLYYDDNLEIIRPKDVRSLAHVLQREGSPMGILIALEPELPDTSETLKKAKREVREREKKKNQPKLGLEE